MDSEVLVKVEGVSKKFCRDLKRSLWYGVRDMTAELIGRNGRHDLLRKDEFWAVKDVSFKLKRGECLGLIGHNGAGKSTLLKILNGLIKPDQGNATMKGRIGALIELGAGFNPILTGRENIYVNGQILGFSRREIDEKYDAIVDFSEIRDFINMPVQNYSSGMRVRLGFAVAAQMEPDVLIIDEVLAVGDIGFRTKCLARINELLQNSAVIFVSHAMNQISRISTEVMLMDHGRIEYQGRNITNGIELYYDKFEGETIKMIGNAKAVEIIDFAVNNTYDQSKNTIPYGESITVKMKFRTTIEAEDYYVMFSFFDKELKGIAVCNSEFQGKIFSKDGNNEIELNAVLPNNFAPGSYAINVHFIEAKGKDTKFGICTYQAIRSFKVVGALIYTQIPIHLSGQWTSPQLKY
jgi:lipopolysaccharide transport system ATP-binding protein